MMPAGPTHHAGTKPHNHIGSVTLHDVLFLEHMPNFQGPLGMPSILLTLNSHENISLEISEFLRKPCLKPCNHEWAIVTSAIHKHTHVGCRGTLHTL